MKCLSRISSILIVFTFVFASENNSMVSSNTDANNVDSNIQAIDLKVLPIDVEKMSQSRIQNPLERKICRLF